MFSAYSCDGPLVLKHAAVSQKNQFGASVRAVIHPP